MGRMIGYARVSTAEQNPMRQIDSLLAAGVAPDCLYIDKQSGKNFARAQYQAMVEKELQSGDVLVVHSLDRLGRNYHGIKDQWRVITQEKGADIVVLDMPLLDTRKEKNLMGTFVADLVLQVLSFMAESERENIRKRQREGIEAARARGVHLGRRANPLPDGFADAWLKYCNGDMTQVDAAKLADMPRSTFRTIAKNLSARFAGQCAGLSAEAIRKALALA